MNRIPNYIIALLVAVWTALVLPAVPCAGAETTAETNDDPPHAKPGRETYFYHGRPYGSEYLIDPVRLIVNGGFGILQMDNRDNGLDKTHYRIGLENVWKNVSHPVSSIEVEGWSTFFKTEVLPFNLDPNRAYYWPNYTQHLIGGGMSSRMMEEWYRAHGHAHPRALAITTLGFYHVLNEVVENDDRRGYRPDPVADIYIFNPLGVILFTNDTVCRFFSHTLSMADWSYQPVVNPAGWELENSGQNFAMKVPLPFFERTSFFYHFGTHGEGGLSWKRANGDAFSIAAGFKGKDIIEVTKASSSVDLGVSAGLFYDRENSLLASLQFARTKDYKMRLNIYPGVVHVGRWSPGFVMALHREDEVLVGVHFGGSPLVPVGLAGSW